MRGGLAFAALALALGCAGPAFAHPLAPSLLELREQKDGLVAVRFRMPRIQSAGASLRPELPASCHTRGAPSLEMDAGSATLRWLADCGPGGLRGAAFRVAAFGRTRGRTGRADGGSVVSSSKRVSASTTRSKSKSSTRVRSPSAPSNTSVR